MQGPYDPKTDTNYYRRISKYDLDARSVDWQALQKDKQRQITYNANQSKKVVGGQEKANKMSEAITKLTKINQKQNEKQQSLMESKMRS